MPRASKPIHTAAEFNLDINDSDDDLFRWFLLSLLFGKPIQSSVAVQTWQIFIDRKIDTPWAIQNLSYRQLVLLLDAGKYTRYDESTASMLHRCMEQLINEYEGSLILMLDSSESEEEFGVRLRSLHGVGPKISEIFMNETAEYFARRVE